MALSTRAGTMVAMPYMRKRTLLSFGALAAGLAMVHKTQLAGTSLGSMRLSGSTPLRIPHRLIYRSQSTLSGLFSSISSTSSDMAITPPQPSLKWTHSAQEILDITKAELANHKAAEDKVAALPPSECNFESVSWLLEPISMMIS